MKRTFFRYLRPPAACIFLLALNSWNAQPATIRVPADRATIQDAINASIDGDTIKIASGLYLEQLTITRKSITLEGAPGATIRATEGLTAQLGLATVFLVGADRCTNLILRGLTFDGNRMGEFYTSFGLSGILYKDSGGRVEDCVIKGFRPADSFGGFGRIGLQASNAEVNSAPEIKISRCRFSDNGVGIHLRGNDNTKSALRLKFSVQNCVLEGNGPSEMDAQIGIWLSPGASGSISGNRITDFRRLPGGDKSIGIMALDWSWVVGFSNDPAALLPVHYENNVFIANQWAIASVKSSGSEFINNSIQGPTSPEAFSGTNQVETTGISITGSSNQVSGNFISNVTRGVVLMGNDPEFGTKLGFARDTKVTANRFCEVKTNVLVQVEATGTESRTSTCPFEFPDLLASPALLLEWSLPGAEPQLESAEDARGPWQRVEAELSTVGTRTSTYVKAGGRARFFRLREKTP